MGSRLNGQADRPSRSAVRQPQRTVSWSASPTSDSGTRSPVPPPSSGKFEPNEPATPTDQSSTIQFGWRPETGTFPTVPPARTEPVCIVRPDTGDDDPADVAAPHTAVGWWHETGQFPVVRGGDELRDWLYPNERQYWVPPRPLFTPQPPSTPFEWNGNGKRIAQGVIAASTVAAVAAGGILAPATAAAVGSVATQATSQFPVITATTMQQAPAQAPGHTAATTSSGDSSYEVKEGDTLHDIAAHFGVSTASLIAANNFKNPDLILPGDKVTIPSGDAAQSLTIKVQSGDTINSLAARYGVSAGVIVKANSLANPDLIVVGQSLAIPGGKAPAAATPASASKSPDPAPSITVTAKDGDTVAKLASFYGVDANTIVSANKLANPNLIRVGQSLVIPGGKQPSGEGGAPAAPAAKQEAP